MTKPMFICLLRAPLTYLINIANLTCWLFAAKPNLKFYKPQYNMEDRILLSENFLNLYI